MKERLIFHLDFNLIENLLDYFNSLQACTQCVFVWWGMGLWARTEGCGHTPLLEKLFQILCLCGGGWDCGRGLRDADTPPLLEKLFQIHHKK